MSVKSSLVAAVVGILFLTGSVQAAELLGAGATFPYPLYSKMFSAYYKTTQNKINYQPIGSGGGIRQLENETVDFAGSDAIVSEKKMAEIGNPILHIPIVAGAVGLTYNLPGFPPNTQLKLTPDVLADIFLGKIKLWNDPKITALNPGVKLPKMRISTVQRADGSGTTYIFTHYLAQVSPDWKKQVGYAKAVKWPVGLAGKGNAGVAGLIKQVPGSIGYVGSVYALQNRMSLVAVRNKAGKYVTPTLAAVSESANVSLSPDTRDMLTNTNAVDGYPISGFTWILLYKDQSYNKRTLAQAKDTIKLISWMIDEGQSYASGLHFAPLPAKAVTRARQILESVTFEGESLAEL